MEARLIGFGEIELAGKRYDYDLVIDAGNVRKRVKKPSKLYRDRYDGHTPLSPLEDIPWSGKRLIVGTGVHGSLPVMPEVYREGEKRGVEVIAVPLKKALEMLQAAEAKEVFAVLHVTC